MLLVTGWHPAPSALSSAFFTLPMSRITPLKERADPMAFLLRTSQSVLGPPPLGVVMENGVTLVIGHLGPICVTDATAFAESV